MKTFWLSMHVPYACRDSGVCCSSRWPIPLERSRVPFVASLRRDWTWLVPAAGAPPEVAGLLALSENGQCVFHNDGCEIQRAVGPTAMPSACRHYPREVLIDPRGVSVTLSHYCPTAADLLFEHRGPVEIVVGPPAVADGAAEGLDARDVLPPLLTDAVLMDHTGYTAWEARMVRSLTTADGRTPEETIADLWRDVADLQRWRPGGSTLTSAIADLPSRPRMGTSVATGSDAGVDVPIRRYLAARAFASWVAYQGHGIAAVIASLALALAVLREEIATLRMGGGDEPTTHQMLKEAIRTTDRLLLHEMPRAELVARANDIAARQMSNSTTTGP